MLIKLLNVIALILFSSNASWATGLNSDLNVDLALGFVLDNNVNRAQSSSDIKNDNITRLNSNITYSKYLSANSGLRLNGGIQIDQHANFSELNNYTVNMGGAYRIQPNVGFTNPWFEINGLLSKQFYNNSPMREGESLLIQAIVGKNITDQISMRGGVAHEDHWADSTSTAILNNVFRWHRNSLFAAIDYKINPINSLLYAKITREHGDQVFDSSPNPSIRSIAKAIDLDPVFGNQRAYRLSAESTKLELGLTTKINASSALDISVLRFVADADAPGFIYTSTVLGVSWLYRVP